MKQLSTNVGSSIKRMVFSSTLLCMLALSSIPSSVYSQANTTAETAMPVDVKYLGRIDEHPVFQVNIDNGLGDFYYFRLTDADGNVLYTEKFDTKKLSRKFQFISENLPNETVTISVVARNGKKSQTYEITSVSKVIQDMAVTRRF